MLILTRRKGEAIQLWIDNEMVAEITVIEVGRGQSISAKGLDYVPIRIGLQAPDHVKIVRSELSLND